MRRSEAIASRQEELLDAAKRRIVRELKTSPATLRKLAHGMAKAKRELGKEWTPHHFDTHGLAIPRQELLALTEITVGLNHAHAALTRAAAALRLLRGSKVQPGLEDLAKRIVALGRECQAWRPRHACVSCKRIPELQPSCLRCHGSGYLTVHQAMDLDERLLSDSHPHVHYRGRIVPCEEVK